VVVVTATDKSNTVVHGSAMMLVYQSPAAEGVAILPCSPRRAPSSSAPS
jgi:hypothetical protein